MDHDQALILAICISAPLYLAILTKFIYDYSRFIYYLLYWQTKTGTMERWFAIKGGII